MAIQHFNLKKIPFVNSKLEQGLTAIVKTKPTSNSDDYELLIRYESLEKHPYVLLLNPNIPKDVRLPHVYPRKKYKGKEYPNLCLYLPGGWNNSLLIADTILLWAIEWLYYYELWIITGKWHGGGELYINKKKANT